MKTVIIMTLVFCLSCSTNTRIKNGKEIVLNSEADRSFLMGFMISEPKKIYIPKSLYPRTFALYYNEDEFVQFKFYVIDEYVTPKTYEHKKSMALSLSEDGFVQLDTNSYSANKYKDNIITLNFFYGDKSNIRKLVNCYNSGQLLLISEPEFVVGRSNEAFAARIFNFTPQYLDSLKKMEYYNRMDKISDQHSNFHDISSFYISLQRNVLINKGL